MSSRAGAGGSAGGSSNHLARRRELNRKTAKQSRVRQKLFLLYLDNRMEKLQEENAKMMQAAGEAGRACRVQLPAQPVYPPETDPVGAEYPPITDGGGDNNSLQSKLERNRQRNRENSKRTRTRKKIALEWKQETVRALEQEHFALKQKLCSLGLLPAAEAGPAAMDTVAGAVEVHFGGTHNLSAPLNVTRDMVLAGIGGSGARVDGGDRTPLLHVTARNVALSGFELCRGNWSHTGLNGGAVTFQGKNATVRGVTFRANNGWSGGAWYGVGEQRFENVSFVNNRAWAPGHGGVHDWLGGGAIFNSRGSVSADGVRFERSVALDHGGAIMNYMGRVHARNCSFVDCHAKQGGAVYTFMWGSVLAEGSLFRGCWAGECPTCHAGSKAGHGGALFSDRGGLAVRRCRFEACAQPVWAWQVRAADRSRNVTIDDSTFIDSHVNGSGAAIANQWSDVTVTRCAFERNNATKPGAILFNDRGSSTLFDGSNFSDTNEGGGQVVLVNNEGGNVTVAGHSQFRVRNQSAAAAGAVKRAFAGCTLESLDVRVEP